jgi:natural product biosynthesis luciferase-like monooxygenase protein
MNATRVKEGRPQHMDFSLFYFANDSGKAGPERYRLLLEGARFADTHDFAALWIPERHLHQFGGEFPNPAVAAAAVAAVTERIAIRSGSVVAPLHNPVRIAEEWSVVDNLSGGRVGLSFASGWNANDFVLQPGNYENRKKVLADTVDTVRRLWRRESVPMMNHKGEMVEIRSYPTPVQPELPFWMTSAGSLETFRQAGELGGGVLTHLLGQSADKLAKKIAVYRQAIADMHGRRGHVALMLHTFLGASRSEVRSIVEQPFSDYLRSSLELQMRSRNMGGADISPEDLDFLIRESFDRYFVTSGLFGTVDDGLQLLQTLRKFDVDEVACLIDFVSDTEAVLSSLQHLDELRRAWQNSPSH